MIPTTSACTKNHSLYYSTKLRIIDQTLSSILQMAQNIFLPAVSKEVSAFWLSNQCKEARKATFQAHFFTKLNVQPDLVPSFIREKLTPQKVQTLVHPSAFSELYPIGDNTTQSELKGCLGLYQAMKHPHDKYHEELDLVNVDLLLDGIHRSEHVEDWVSSYFLAHVLGTSRLSKFLHKYDHTTNTSVTRQFLPYSSWLILLQRPGITEHLLMVFKKTLPSLGLNFERKIHCIESVINVYRRQKTDNIIRRDCLSILLQLSLEPEGRRVLLEADGQQFLIDKIKSTSDNFMQRLVHAKAKYILANLMLDNIVLQSILENEPSILQTMLKDLDGNKELSYHPDSLNYLMNLLRVVGSLPPTLKAQQLIVIEHTLFSIEKIKSWLRNKPSPTNFSIFQELILIENDIKLLSKTLKKRYSLTLPEIVEDPDSPSQAKLCPARRQEKVTEQSKQESAMIPASETPQKLSKSCDACCRIA